MKVKLIELKRAYNRLNSDEETVEINGSLFYGGYLKYLIEYLEICKAQDMDVIELKPTMKGEDDGSPEEKG